MKRIAPLLVLVAVCGLFLSGAAVGQQKDGLLVMETEAANRRMPFDAFLRAIGKLLNEEYLITQGDYSKWQIAVPENGLRREEWKRLLGKILLDNNFTLVPVSTQDGRKVYALTDTGNRNKLSSRYVDRMEDLSDDFEMVRFVYPVYTTYTMIHETIRTISGMLSHFGYVSAHFDDSNISQNDGTKNTTMRSGNLVICDTADNVRQIVRVLERFQPRPGHVSILVILTDVTEQPTFLAGQSLSVTDNAQGSFKVQSYIPASTDSLGALTMSFSCTAHLREGDSVLLDTTATVNLSRQKEAGISEWRQECSVWVKLGESVEYDAQSTDGSRKYKLTLTPTLVAK